jgi:hypothetical protein
MSCKHASRLISDSMDRQLTAGERLSLRFHLLVCRLCCRYQRQLLLIRRAIQPLESAARVGEELPSSLSPAARERIRQALAPHI